MQAPHAARTANRLRTALLTLGVAGAAMVLLCLSGCEKKPQRPPAAQVIQIVRPPPPPPQNQPPPPPPPPDKVEAPLPQNDPDPAPADNSPAEQLGLDAEGVAGSDAFGFAARRGGTDLVGTGSAFFSRYTSLVKDALLDQLADESDIRHGSYSVTVRVWVGKDGRVEKVKLMQGTGKRDLDGAIEKALSRVQRVSESPPLEMPQPVTLKIVSRG